MHIPLYITIVLYDFAVLISSKALGYMCEEMDIDAVDAVVVDQILCSIIDGMQATRKTDVRLAAVKALNNTLPFTESNFENAPQRDAIMAAICGATQSTDETTRVRAFECMSTVGSYYYDKLPPYFDSIFQLTCGAIRSDSSKVGEQAVEFWCTICERECDILEECDQLEDGQERPSYFKIIEQAAVTLIPLMLEMMTKQEEDQNSDDTWNISLAAAMCLGLIARTIGDSAVDLTVPFITANIGQENWRLKEAAVMAFCQILDGPSDEKITPLVSNALPILLTTLSNKTELVRSTTMYTVSRILECHGESLDRSMFSGLVQGILLGLDDAEEAGTVRVLTDRLCALLCWGFSGLV